MEKSAAIALLKSVPPEHLSAVDLARTWHVARAVNTLPGRRVLNIGCGFGLLETILDGHRQLLGIDHDEHRIAVARRYNAGRASARFEKLDLYRLSAAGAADRFNIAVLSEVLEHLADEDRVLQTIRSVLADDGHLVISVPNVHRFKDRFYGHTSGVNTRMAPDHVREYTRESLRHSLERNGFEVLHLAGSCVGLPTDRLLRAIVPHHSFVRDYIAQRHPDWASYFIAVARPGPASDKLPPPSPAAPWVKAVTRITARRNRGPLARAASSLLWRGIRTVNQTEEFFLDYFSPNTGHRRWQSRAACLLLSFDLDHQADIDAVPRVLEILKPYGWPVTCACIGAYLTEWPREHEQLLRHGYELINHTHRHPPNPAVHGGRAYPQLTAAELRDEIAGCHEACLKQFGYTMQGFRAPHFGDQQNTHTHRCLAELGYRYSSSLIATHASRSAHGLPYLQDGVLEIPISPSPLAPSATLETYTVTRSAQRLSPAEYLAAFERLLQVGLKTNSLINVYFDPRDIVASPGLFTQVFDLIRRHETELWIPSYRDLADHWLRHGDAAMPSP